MPLDLFKEILPSIMNGKEKVIDSETVDDFVPFVVNKGLSYHQDTCLYANDMNMFGFLPKQMQYDYLFYGIRKRKRPFQPWIKSEKNTDLDIIRKYYNVSLQTAKQYLSLLSQEQIKEINNRMSEGGKVGK